VTDWPQAAKVLKANEQTRRNLTLLTVIKGWDKKLFLIPLITAATVPVAYRT